MSQGLKISSPRRAYKLVGTFFAIASLMLQPLVSLNIPAVFAASDAVGTLSVSVIPSPSSDKGESVTLSFTGTGALDLAGWSLDETLNTPGKVYAFTNQTLTNGQTLTLCGDMTKVANCTVDYGSSNVWNNDADATVLRDMNGEVVRAEWTKSPGENVALSSHTAVNYSTVTAELKAENFNTVNDNYKGVSVGFNASNFGTVSSVIVTLKRADLSTVSKVANQEVKDLISNQAGPVQLTAPFVIQEGSFTELSDAQYWQPAPAVWTDSTAPISVDIAVTDENGTKRVSSNTFNQGAPSWPTYQSLLPATAVTNTNTGATYDDLQSAVDGAQAGETLRLNKNLSLASDVDVTNSVTIDGNNYMLTGDFVKVDGSNNSVLSVQADNVVVQNLTVDGVNSGVNKLHGVNVYESTDVTVDNVTARNFLSGVAYNSSTGIVKNGSFSNNAWHDINVDQKTSQAASVTVTGTNIHDGSQADIYVDDDTKGVTVTANNYSWVRSNLPNRDHDQVYTLNTVDTDAPSVPAATLKDNDDKLISNDGFIGTDSNKFRFDLSSTDNVAVTNYKL